MKNRPKCGPYKMSRPEVTQPLDTSFRLIPLTQNQVAIVDAADFEWLSKFNWCAYRRRNRQGFYAMRTSYDGRIKTDIWMHREILKCPTDKQCDHRNRDSLDNRRANLREATYAENARNHGAWQSNKSGRKGVTWHANNRKWHARIGHEYSVISLGYFPTIEEAGNAYDEAAKKYHGEFAG
jgi:hypothetical protein